MPRQRRASTLPQTIQDWRGIAAASPDDGDAAGVTGGTAGDAARAQGADITNEDGEGETRGDREDEGEGEGEGCLLYTSPSPRDRG